MRTDLLVHIAMIRHEVVKDEYWLSRERFNRTLTCYHVLPGPAAHALCIDVGMLARRRLSGLLAV